MRRSRAPSIAPGTFFVAQSWADCITNMAGFNLRQAQPTGGATRAALSLTFDHRVVTGGEAARFMVALKSDLERTS